MCPTNQRCPCSASLSKPRIRRLYSPATRSAVQDCPSLHRSAKPGHPSKKLVSLSGRLQSGVSLKPWVPRFGFFEQTGSQEVVLPKTPVSGARSSRFAPGYVEYQTGAPTRKCDVYPQVVGLDASGPSPAVLIVSTISPLESRRTLANPAQSAPTNKVNQPGSTTHFPPSP